MNSRTSYTSRSAHSKSSTSRTRAKSGRFVSRHKPSERKCAECLTVDSVQWRTGARGNLLCNACGIRERRALASSSNSNNGHGSRKRSVSTLAQVPISSLLTEETEPRKRERSSNSKYSVQHICN